MVPLFGRDPAVSVARPMSLKGSRIRAVKAVLPRMPRDAISITKTNRVFSLHYYFDTWDLQPWIANSPIPINPLTYAKNCMNS
ncbi:hypothetical protein CDAR_126141 [Caerostris darwini]|uniref:Uncharacterized protein n=1 Tax=Caerostris darwini TaxID=1538125 RepID=A0AAV4SA26_9ARAC|nr:hypothetical protein CDAR_126141 [Caerostris darwini]